MKKGTRNRMRHRVAWRQGERGTERKEGRGRDREWSKHREVEKEVENGTDAKILTYIRRLRK